MIKKAIYYFIGLIALGSFVGCGGDETDSPPPAFKEIVLRPDVIYIYNGNVLEGTRLDPLLNDSIKVEATIHYSVPAHGTISFIPNEGWFYKPDEGFLGVDNLEYTLCHNKNCASTTMSVHVEEPMNWETCMYSIAGESVSTTVNTPLEIRIFSNDVVCPMNGFGMNSPEKGTFSTYSYSGSYKNTVYVYYPPKDFIGTDRFSYKIFTDDGDKQVYCNITITN